MSSNLTEQTITEAVQRTFDTSTDERFRQLFVCLVQHLHDFAREVRLTGDEWFTAMDFIERVGKISSPTRQEVVLLSDILGLSMLLDTINQTQRVIGHRLGSARPVLRRGPSDGRQRGRYLRRRGGHTDVRHRPGCRRTGHADRRRPCGHLAQRRRRLLRRSADREAARRVRHAGAADHRRRRPVLVPVHHSSLLPGAHRRPVRGDHARRKPIRHAAPARALLVPRRGLPAADHPTVLPGRPVHRPRRGLRGRRTRCRPISCGTSPGSPRTERPSRSPS